VGVKDLAASPHLRNLRELDLSGNDVTGEGLAELRASPLYARLVKVNVDDNNLATAADNKESTG